MTVNISSNAEIDSVRLTQQGNHPSSPASGYESLYVISGSPHGGLFLKDSAGKQIGPFITGSPAAAGGGNLSVTFEGSTTTYGADTNRTSGGTYTSHRGLITVNTPMKIHQVLWDVAITGTWGARMFQGWSTGTSPILDFGTTGTLGALEINFTNPTPNTLILPGDYTLELYTTPAKSIADNTENPDTALAYFPSHSVKHSYYNTTLDDAFTPAFKLVYYKGAYS